MKNCFADEIADATDFVPHVLIETKKLHDHEFANEWLLKVVETRRLWKELLQDRSLKKSSPWMGRLCVGDFGEYLVSSVRRRFANGAKSSVAIVNSERSPIHYWPEIAILVRLGFFVLSGDFYHPSIPKSPTKKEVQQAAEKVNSIAIAGLQGNAESLLHVLTEDEVDELLAMESITAAGKEPFRGSAV